MDSKWFCLEWVWIDLDFLHSLFLVDFASVKHGLPRVPPNTTWKQCRPQFHNVPSTHHSALPTLSPFPSQFCCVNHE